MSQFSLPPAPPSQTGPVKIWSEPVTIPTYVPMPPDRNPMFLEKRVYQGSNGKVYPLPFIDRIRTKAEPRAWQAVHLENEFLRVMILPEIGGRIHVGLDKTNGYDFFYRQNVIKPALVGLAGPWISGGVEFNWPQHHRPATFMPVAFHVEEDAGGARTVWLSDHDPMNRLKGMHGVTLHPGRAYIELQVRLYNRTPFVQTFLWWANVAARVHEQYQSFFPPDVRYVADHARRAISTFPLCTGTYYGVDYDARAHHGVPDGRYPPNDLSRYANIPVPTSYMILGSKEDFFGGYDHGRSAGFVHIANHHISPGKKQWTWGNHEFGYAWDRNLTDHDGPYIELMAGVYTDNQPDFSFLAPGETRTFSQYWYPIQQIGPAQKANLDAAVSLQIAERSARVGVSVSRPFPQAAITLDRGGAAIAQWTRDLAPGAPFVETHPVPADDVSVRVRNAEGQEIIRYAPLAVPPQSAPVAATEPPLPEEIAGTDELYITGLHLEQYRHATRDPDIYWREALRRDPGDARSNNALGAWHLRRGEFAEAEKYFRVAIARLTERNANPRDGEPYYNLGLTLRYRERDEEAYAAFYKATWNYAWRGAAYHGLAELDARRGDWHTAIRHLELALRVNADNLQARNLLSIALRKLGREPEAAECLRATLALDPLDAWANDLAGRAFPGDNQVRLDVAFDLARAGLNTEAARVLAAADFTARDGSLPILHYTLAHLSAGDHGTRAAQTPPDYCFPSRLEEMIVLEAAMRANPRDARAPYYLGNLLYDRRRHREAIARWETAASLDPAFATVWRNLGIGYYNVGRNQKKARAAFEKAHRAGPSDARIFYERDQLWKHFATPKRRLAEMEKRRDLVGLRDDLSVALASLYNQTGQPGKAAALLAGRKFQPWEGGEGLALTEHTRAQLALGRRDLSSGRAADAYRYFERALASPENLGEAKHLLANQSNIYYWLGRACHALGKSKDAQTWWRKAAAATGDFREMSVVAYSDMTYYSAMALACLGRRRESTALLEGLRQYAMKLKRTKAKVDYFATSLPAMLLFQEDLQKRAELTADFLLAQAAQGLGRKRRASQLLDEILARDPNHAAAADFRSELACRQGFSGK
ncbi:MAG TPA: DUF5107 domain-containing protein [Bryobacteraceae bacterium]|nr:DUF5107 domain-containing protein [Bryobacteraceae bacterium]